MWAPRPKPKLKDNILSVVRQYLFTIFANTLHIGGRSSIRNLRTRHAVVIWTHISWSNCNYNVTVYRIHALTLRLLMSYIYGAPSKARNANVVYIWTYVWQRWNSHFLFSAQCFNTESMQRVFLCHICV